MDLGGDPAVLLEQGRYGELLTVLDRSPGSAEALVWAVRCRVEQGYIRAAADLVRKAPPPARAACGASIALRLWRGFLALYESGDRPFAEIVAEFRGQCEELAVGASAPVIALAGDLRCRAEMMRFVLSGMGPRHRGALVSSLAATADGYRAAGLLREAAGALRRAASFACDGLAAQRAEGRELLAQASAEAAASGFVIARANADLALAELDFRALLDGTGELDQREVVGKFDAAAEGFRTGGHAFGDALVMWSAARWLLAYGQSSGLDLARAAAGEFAAADVPSSELQVFRRCRPGTRRTATRGRAGKRGRTRHGWYREWVSRSPLRCASWTRRTRPSGPGTWRGRGRCWRGGPGPRLGCRPPPG